MMKKKNSNSKKLNIIDELNLIEFKLDKNFEQRLEKEFISKSQTKSTKNIFEIFKVNKSFWYFAFVINTVLILALSSFSFYPRNSVNASEVMTTAHANNSQLAMFIAYNFANPNSRLTEQIDINQRIKSNIDIRDLPIDDKNFQYIDTLVRFENGPKFNHCDKIRIYDERYKILHSYEYVDSNDEFHFKLKTHRPNTDLTEYITSVQGEIITYEAKDRAAITSKHPESLNPNNVTRIENININELWDETTVDERQKNYNIEYNTQTECGEIITQIEVDKQTHQIQNIALYSEEIETENLIQTAFISYSQSEESADNLDIEEIFRYELNVDLIVN